jgi:hypothetical protein
VDVDFRFDDRHQASRQDLAAEVELLIHTDFTPASLASLMTERILVPNRPLSVARARSASKPGIGFMTWTPSSLPVRPLSTFKKGTTCLTVQS